MRETPSVPLVVDSLSEALDRATAADAVVSAVLDLQSACRDAVAVAREDPEAAGVLAPRLFDVLDRPWQPEATATALWGLQAAGASLRATALEALRWVDAGALLDAIDSPDCDWTVEEAVDVLLTATSASGESDRVRWTLEVVESLAWVAPNRVGERAARVVDWVLASFDVDADRRRSISLRLLLLVTCSTDAVPAGTDEEVEIPLRSVLQQADVPSKLLAATVADALDIDLPFSLAEWATAEDRHISVVLAEQTRLSLEVLLEDLAALGYAVTAIRLGQDEDLVEAPIQQTTHLDRPSVAETVGAQFVLDAVDFDTMVEQDGEDFVRMAALVGHAVSLDEFPDDDARTLFARRVRTQAPRGRLAGAVALGILAKLDYDAATREPMHERLEHIVTDEGGFLQSVAADALGFLVATDTETPLTALVEDGAELTRLHAAGALGLLVAATEGTDSSGDDAFDAGITALTERVAARYDPRVRTATNAGLVGVEAEALGFALAASDREFDETVTELCRAVFAAPDDYRQQYAVAAGIAYALGSGDDGEDVPERVATALRSSVGGKRQQLSITLGYIVRETGTTVAGPVSELALERATAASELPNDEGQSLMAVQALTVVVGEVAADRLASDSALIPLAEAVFRSRGQRQRQRSMVRDAVLARLDDDTSTTAILERFVDQQSRYRQTAVGLLRVVKRYQDGDVGDNAIDRLVALSRYGRDDGVVEVATEILETATASGLATLAELEPEAQSGDGDADAVAGAFGEEPPAKQSALLGAYRAIADDDPERIRRCVPMLRAFVATEAPDQSHQAAAVAVLATVPERATPVPGARDTHST